MSRRERSNRSGTVDLGDMYEVPPEALRAGAPISIDAACGLLGVGEKKLTEYARKAGIRWPVRSPRETRVFTWEQFVTVSDLMPLVDENGDTIRRVSAEGRERMRENGRRQSARNRMRFLYGKKAGRKSA